MSCYKRICFFVLGLIFFFNGTHAQVGFPYCETFDANSPRPTTVFGGGARLVEGALRLTEAIQNQSGFVYIDIPFSSVFGIKCSFEYFSYGGSGADGLTVFLFDAAIPFFSPGGFGGSLGYAQRFGETGLTGGYLGVGFDSYGNFANSSEGRLGGFPGPQDQLYPNSVGLRGPGSGFNGYPFITGRLTNATGPLGLPQDQLFVLSSGGVGTGRVTMPQSIGYRKVFLDLEPNSNGNGYLLTVEMMVTTTAGSPRMVRIMSKEPYPYTAPKDLKIGFAASTGGLTNIHEIKNLTIEVSNADLLQLPGGVDLSDKASCEGQNNTYEITTDQVNLPNENSNIRCLRFYPSLEAIQREEEDICLQGSCDPERRMLQLPQGTFTADEEGGGFTFYPNFGFRDQVVKVYYTITDSYGKKSTGNAIELLIQESPEQVFVYVEGEDEPAIGKRLCAGEAITLEAKGAEVYRRFEWFLDGLPIPAAQGSKLQVDQPGEYVVKAYNLKNCPTQSSAFVLDYPDFPLLTLLADPVVGCIPGQNVDVLSYVPGADLQFFDYRMIGPTGMVLLNEEIGQVASQGSYLLSVKHKDLDCWSAPIDVDLIILKEPFTAMFDYAVEGSGIKDDEGGGVFIDDPIRFTNLSAADAVSWQWDFGDGTSSEEFSPVHTFGKKGNYKVKLTATNALGCIAEYEAIISLNLVFRIMIPTGFTPDMNENKYFWPKFKGIASMEMYIFNMWGNMVYYTQDLNANGWDGTFEGRPLPSGDYAYRINFVSSDGEQLVETGKLILIR